MDITLPISENSTYNTR